MQQIADWLEKLGMSEYAQCFAENKIDVSVLRHLTDQDLKDIGVPLGHRRKILAAIGELGGATSVTTEPAAGAEPKAQETAERRQVTVMFSDLVGSTALSARMDPEDLREVISAYQTCVAETVGRLGGFIAKFMGDGVLVYFGYPHAHEDDAERAVRAGLELVASVGALKTHAPLQTRVGIATGLVVVGDLIGSGASQEQAIVGETPNLAARLQGVAEPNAVVVAESTRKLVGNLFELKDLGAQDLKGIAGPVRAWAALRPASVESRFEALHTSGLTELVGREEELEILLRRWSRAKSGQGQVVLLSGEAGIGKSRLTAALLERLAPEPHTRLRYLCSPQRTDSAFFPINSQMERVAGFTHADTAQVKLDKLDAVLVPGSTSARDAALFAEMLSLPNDGRYPVLDLDPQQRRQRTLEAFAAQIEVLSGQNPVLMIFEDAHWADPTTLEAFDRAVDRFATLRVLLLITFRPDFEPPWVGQPHVTTLTINRLTRREVEAMIDRVVGNKVLPTSIRQDIIERTDGIPLFVEEMTKAVLEAESQRAACTAAAIPSPVAAVPATLRASLMARLDQLGAAGKEVAQVGAAIGREFSHALLAAVMQKREADLQSALNRPVAAGLLFQQGVPPYATYLFKHALVQDAAYSTLLREPRRALHARIASTLENQFAEIAENQPEVLARHCTEAGLIEKAAGLWGKAGQRSIARSTMVEAGAQFTRALDLIATLPPTAAQRSAQITLQAAVMSIYNLVKGHAAPETRAAAEQARLLIEQAERLGEPLEDPLALFRVLYVYWVGSFLEFSGDTMRELAAQFMALAEKQRATAPLIMGHRLMGVYLLYTGDIAQGRAYLDQSIALFNPLEHRLLLSGFGTDAGVAALSVRSLALWALGHPEAALADTERALKDAREIRSVVTLMFALHYAAMTHIACGNYAAAKAQYDELIALAHEKDIPLYRAVGTSGRGSLLALIGKVSDAVHKITSGISAMRSAGIKAHSPFYLSILAGARAGLGQFDDARRCIEEAIAAVEATGERWCEAEIYRIAGEIALKLPEPDVTKTEAYFQRALSIARQQQAKSWELRASMSLARLWRDQGKPQQARELLAPVYGWFTEGFDTLDLKDAKALLDELHA